MAAPDPEGISLLGKLLGYGAASMAAVGGAVKLWNMKADKTTVNNQFQQVNTELSVQRGHIGKIFDQMRESEKAARDRHDEMLKAIYERK